MNTPNQADAVRYDRARGVVLLRDSAGAAWIEYAAVAALTDAIQAGAIHTALLPRVGGYGLALAAHEHSGWPTESRRAALIQAAEQLRNASPTSEPLDHMLDTVLALANDALLRGDPDIARTLADCVEGR